MTPPQLEPWLRGTLTTLAPELRAVLHALELAREDVALWCGPLEEPELFARPHSLPSVAFHLRHIVGSLDRLLTYAEGRALNDAQKVALDAEMHALMPRHELFALWDDGLTAAEDRIRAIDPAQWSQPRTVGRKQLPTTVAGLVIHCADHTQRHVGQAITTAKILLGLREQS